MDFALKLWKHGMGIEKQKRVSILVLMDFALKHESLFQGLS